MSHVRFQTTVAMDLAYLTGQRPADVLAMRKDDIKRDAEEGPQDMLQSLGAATPGCSRAVYSWVCPVTTIVVSACGNAKAGSFEGEFNCRNSGVS